MSIFYVFNFTFIYDSWQLIAENKRIFQLSAIRESYETYQSINERIVKLRVKRKLNSAS